MAFGITSVGFVQKVFTEVKDSLETRIKTALGSALDFAPQSNAGQLSGIFSEFIGDVWQLAQDVYSAYDPDSSSGAALDALAGLTGTIRLPAASSTVDLLCTGTTGTILTAGRTVSVDPTLVRFTTDSTATIAAATAWVSSTAYALGDIRKNSTGPARIYVCRTAGTSAGSGGPTTTSDDITDGSVHWRYVGDGDGYVSVAASSEDTGPKVAEAFTLVNIETAVSGWANVTNLLDATLGQDIEADSALRVRREEELRSGGKGSVESIKADVLKVADVIQCTVFENTTDLTDGDGLPPHSFETLVQGGAEADIAEAIFLSKPAGIATYGTTTEPYLDSQGITHDVLFTYVEEVTIWVNMTVSVDTNTFPSDGAAQIKTAIVEWGDAQKAGRDAVQNFIRAQALTIDGVLDVTVCLLGTTNPAATNANITITSRQIAVYDTSRISVTAAAGTP